MYRYSKSKWCTGILYHVCSTWNGFVTRAVIVTGSTTLKQDELFIGVLNLLFACDTYNILLPHEYLHALADKCLFTIICPWLNHSKYYEQKHHEQFSVSHIVSCVLLHIFANKPSQLATNCSLCFHPVRIYAYCAPMCVQNYDVTVVKLQDSFS